MPDTSTLEMPQSGGGGGGIPGWVMLVGAVAGIAGLFLLLKGSGGQGTTAAGTSINAALGSIQEENMNLLGVTQAGFQQQALTLGGITQAQQDAATQAASNFQALSGGQEYWGRLNTSETQQAASRLQLYLQGTQNQQQAGLDWIQNVVDQLYQYDQYLPWLVGPSGAVNGPNQNVQVSTTPHQSSSVGTY